MLDFDLAEKKHVLKCDWDPCIKPVERVESLAALTNERARLIAPFFCVIGAGFLPACLLPASNMDGPHDI